MESQYQNQPQQLNRRVYVANPFVRFAISTIFWCAGLYSAHATVLQLPTNGDSVVGQFQQAALSSSDTFADIARVYNVGYNELVAANPNIDPWLPPEGATIVIPSQYVLPNVPWEGIVVNIAEMRMYYFPKTQKSQTPIVYTFPIGIGRENWETPVGEFKVVDKIVNPVWTVPQSVLDEARVTGRKLPAVVPPGPDNPLGDHAITLNVPGYTIHGTNQPLTIGRRVSHGCLRLYPEDVEQLVNLVPRGVKVKIIDEPVKVGRKNDVLYVEIHPPLKQVKNGEMELRTGAVAAIEDFAGRGMSHETWKRVFQVTTQLSGVPIPVADLSQNSSDTQWILRVESMELAATQEQFAERFKQMAMPIFNSDCNPYQACVDLGLFSSVKFRDAAAEFLKYGYGLHSANLIQNAEVGESEL